MTTLCADRWARKLNTEGFLHHSEVIWAEASALVIELFDHQQ